MKHYTYFISVLIVLLVMTCVRSHGQSPEELAHTATKYWQKQGKEITFPVVFGEVPAGFVAVCIMVGNKAEKIVVSEKEWTTRSELDRMYTMVHEVGHCVFGQGHYGDGIMRAVLPTNDFDKRTVLLFMRATAQKEDK